MLRFVVTLTAVLCSAYGQQECSPGTTKGVGCQSFQRCNSFGTDWAQVDCRWPDEAVNFNGDGFGNADCVSRSFATPPCDLDCANYGPLSEDLCFRDNLQDGNYPVYELLNPELRHCDFFFSCLNQQCLGFQPCEEGLVFDIRLGICNFIYSVPPPCGTASN